MDPLICIALVMLVSGAVGGLANHFLTDPQSDKPLTWWQHVFVGIAAAYIVPLFLNMASGDLIDKIRGTAATGGADYSRLFVLAGFCLVAAASSRAFIQSVSKQVLQEARSAQRSAAEAQEQAAEAKAAVAPFVEGELPDDEATGASGKAAAGDAKDVRKVALSKEEGAVIRALANSHFSMRSTTGIAKDSGLSKPVVNATLSQLLSKRYIAQSQSSSGQSRWSLTPHGRAPS